MTVVPSEKNSICFVGQHYYKFTIGGAETQMYLLASEFVRRGWEVHYATTDVEHKMVDQGIQLHPFNCGKRLPGDYGNLTSVLSFINANVYYVRGRSHLLGGLHQYAKKHRKPYIFALSMDIDCRTYKSLPRVFFEKRGNVFKVLWNAPYAFWSDRMSLNGMREATLVLCQSEMQRKALKDNLNIESALFRNIHPASAEKDIEKSKPPTVLWLASVKGWKQPELFVQLAERLRHLDCRFVLAGRLADSSYMEILEKATERLDNFEYVEDVPFEQSNALMSKASVFVNTSLENEGFPNTFIQAWLRMVPVVSLNVDPDDIIKTFGLGCHSKTFAGLEHDVTQLINNPEKRKSIGVSARRTSSEMFGAEENFGKFYTIVQQIIDEK